jgi:hypothetical protein
LYLILNVHNLIKSYEVGVMSIPIFQMWKLGH